MKLKYILIHTDDAVLVKCTQSFSLCAKLLCEKIMPEVRYKSNKKKSHLRLCIRIFIYLYSVEFSECFLRFRDVTLKEAEKEKQEGNWAVRCLLCFSPSCFLPGKQSTDAVNGLLTWASNETDGMGWGGNAEGRGEVGGRGGVSPTSLH